MSSLENIRLVIPKTGQAILEPQSRPQVNTGEVLLRTSSTLISPGTELALFTGTHSALHDPEVTFAKYPYYPGYASVSQVVEASPELRDLFAVGERIYHWGRHCTWTLMRPAEEVWMRLPAGFAEAEILFARLAQISAVATYRPRSKPRSVLVLGAGMIGNFCAQWFQLAGTATVVIQDINSTRLGLAQRCGVRNCISGEGAHRGHFGPEGPDCVVEATGVPALVPDALRWVRRSGDVILLGSPRGKQELDIYKYVHAKSVALIGAHEGGVPNHAGDGSVSRQKLMEESVSGVASGRIKIDGLLSAEISPSEIGSVYEAMVKTRDQYMGVVVHW